MGTPPPVGFGWSQYAVAAAYATPIASFFIPPFFIPVFTEIILGRCIRWRVHWTLRERLHHEHEYSQK